MGSDIYHLHQSIPTLGHCQSTPSTILPLGSWLQQHRELSSTRHLSHGVGEVFSSWGSALTDLTRCWGWSVSKKETTEKAAASHCPFCHQQLLPALVAQSWVLGSVRAPQWCTGWGQLCWATGGAENKLGGRTPVGDSSSFVAHQTKVKHRPVCPRGTW